MGGCGLQVGAQDEKKRNRSVRSLPVGPQVWSVSERFEIVSIARVRFKPFVQFKFKPIDGAVVAPQGFLAGGIFCDIKRLGTGKGSDKGRKRDLCLLVSETPAAVAGLFTTNQICAAPVKVCVSRVAKGVAQAVVSTAATPTPAPGVRV